MSIIFFFSNNNSNESSYQSKGFIYNSIEIISKIFNVDTSKEQINNIIEIIEYPVRKCAHIFLYFVLAILVTSLLKCYNLNIKQIIFYSFMICLIYAIMDEIHQLFTPGRSGNINDLFIDSLGIYLGVYINKYFCKNGCDRICQK